MTLKQVRARSESSLERLYSEHGAKVSDKWLAYLPEYQRILEEYTARPVRLLEIGVQNGGSLEIWARFFPNARILVGCDVDPRCAGLRYEDPRIAVVIGDVNSVEARRAILERSAEFDIVIDDGSHRSADVAKSFVSYFPTLTNGGVYVVEDLHCSYWREYGGGLYDPYSSMAFFKRLADTLNHEHWGVDRSRTDVLRGFFQHHGAFMAEEDLERVHSIHFANSLCAVRKDLPARNRLNGRVIAGSTEAVEPGLRELHGQPSAPSDQTGNEWSAREQPPEEELPARLRELAESERRIASLDGEVAGLSAAIQDGEEKLAEAASTVASREATIAAMEEILASEREQRSALEGALASREAGLLACEGRLASSDAELRICREELRARSEEVSRLRHDVAALQASVSEILASISWRASAPLRFLGAAMQKLRARVRTP